MTDDRFTAVRATEFPWADRTVYMDAASFAPLPARSLAAVERFSRWKHEPFQLQHTELGAVLARSRDAAARLIGATAAEIALAPNTSAGIALAAALLLQPRERGGLRGERSEIVISDREFPANFYPWASADRLGLRLTVVSTDERGCPREDALLERLDSGDVAALAISAVQFSTGFRADIARIGRACRERAVLFVVDAIQALGAVPMSVADTHIDILSCGGQKFLCAPFGTGFFYVRRELVSALEPPFPTWLAFTSSADFAQLLDYRYELVDDARRFETGTVAFQDFAGFDASVRLLLELGTDEIWTRILAVQEPLVDWLQRRPDVVVAAPLDVSARSAITCIRPPAPARVTTALRDAGIVCALREGAVRIAPHFYNTPDEMEQVVQVLEREVKP